MENESPFNSAVRQFELTEANLVKLEKLWERIESKIPDDICFGESIDEYIHAYKLLIKQLPKVCGMRPTSIPMSLDEIAKCRFDAREVGELDCMIHTEDMIKTPESELREYRLNLEHERRKLIRSSVEKLIANIDSELHELKKKAFYSQPGGTKIDDQELERMRDLFNELTMVVGKDIPEKSRWNDLQRHLRFGQAHDLRDIVETDWPDVREALSLAIFGEFDPIPVEVRDLSELVETNPSGRITTSLNWEKINDSEFERLVFLLFSGQEGYENVEWLMKTNAPDKGRDISAYRVNSDGFGGTIRFRTIIQCKHWLSKSISVTEISSLESQMKLWEPPRVDVHIIATSGRFTSDAVSLVEKNNQEDKALRIELWADSRLEQILASRPALIAEFGLR